MKFVRLGAIQKLAVSPLDRVIVDPLSIVLIIKALDKLQELQVVLILGFDEFLHFDVPLDPLAAEHLLEDFVVLHKLVLGFSVPINFVHLD